MTVLQISSLRFLLLILSVLLILFQGGCATSPGHYPSLDLHNKLQTLRIALVPARKLLEETEIDPRKSSGQKFAAGAGLAVLDVAATDPFALILLPIVLPIAAGIHFTAEAIKAPPKGVTESIKQTTHQALEHFDMQMDLSERVLSEANKIGGLTMELVPEMGSITAQEKPDYRHLAEDGFDRVLEINGRIGLFPLKEKDPRLILVVLAHARIVEVGTLEEVYKKEFKLFRFLTHYSEWAASGVETIEGNLNEVLEKLAQKIVENFFIVPELGLPSGTSWGHGGTPGGSEYGCCWICPQYPQNTFSLSWKGGVVLNYNKVYSLRPELRWNAFPNSIQAKKIIKRTGAAISDVRYDLRIWEFREEKRDVLVYERSGLILPSHTLKQPLSPNTHHFWSFRACFQLAGGSGCTPWAFSAVPWTPKNCSYPQIPYLNYYRFQTPED
jgi:hypothetical protein